MSFCTKYNFDWPIKWEQMHLKKKTTFFPIEIFESNDTNTTKNYCRPFDIRNVEPNRKKSTIMWNKNYKLNTRQPNYSFPFKHLRSPKSLLYYSQKTQTEKIYIYAWFIHKIILVHQLNSAFWIHKQKTNEKWKYNNKSIKKRF